MMPCILNYDIYICFTIFYFNMIFILDYVKMVAASLKSCVSFNLCIFILYEGNIVYMKDWKKLQNLTANMGYF
jgi:hypothetical protein